MMPRLDSVWPIRAVSFMSRKWQAMAISMPPPIAWPLMAAMTGLGKRSILRITLLPKRMKASTSPPENAEPRSAPPQKILSPAPVMTTERTLSSSRTAFSASFSSRISGSLMALAGGRLSVTIANDSSRARMSVSNPIAGDSFEKDVGHGLGGVRQAVTALAEHPGGRDLVHGAEEHLGRHLHGQVGAEHAGLHALLEQRAHEARHLLAEEGDEDLLLRLEVEVDGAAGDARLARDVGHARVVEAVARKHAHGRVDDLLGLVGIAHGS